MVSPALKIRADKSAGRPSGRNGLGLRLGGSARVATTRVLLGAASWPVRLEDRGVLAVPAQAAQMSPKSAPIAIDRIERTACPPRRLGRTPAVRALQIAYAGTRSANGKHVRAFWYRIFSFASRDRSLCSHKPPPATSHFNGSTPTARTGSSAYCIPLAK